MCLIAWAYRTVPDFDLVLIANRDEFHARPTEPLHWWEGENVLAGRDLQAGGTWLGVDAAGRLAAVTNVRERGAEQGTRSRGELPVGFLRSELSAADYSACLRGRHPEYAGFNLLLFDGQTMLITGNRLENDLTVPPGIGAVSNAAGTEPRWPKVQRTEAALAAHQKNWSSEEAMLSILRDGTPAAEDQLPDTGLTRKQERALSAPFIRGAKYGTRASTVVWVGKQRVRVVERRFAGDGGVLGDNDISTTRD